MSIFRLNSVKSVSILYTSVMRKSLASKNSLWKHFHRSSYINCALSYLTRINISCTTPKLRRITGLSIRTNNLRVWMAAHTPASHYYGAENEFVRRETQTVWINRGFLAGWVAMAFFLSLSSMFVRE